MAVRSSGLSQTVSPTHPDLPICVYTHSLRGARAKLINSKDERQMCTLCHSRQNTAAAAIHTGLTCSAVVYRQPDIVCWKQLQCNRGLSQHPCRLCPSRRCPIFPSADGHKHLVKGRRHPTEQHRQCLGSVSPSCHLQRDTWQLSYKHANSPSGGHLSGGSFCGSCLHSPRQRHPW